MSVSKQRERVTNRLLERPKTRKSLNQAYVASWVLLPSIHAPTFLVTKHTFFLGENSLSPLHPRWPSTSTIRALSYSLILKLCHGDSFVQDACWSGNWNSVRTALKLPGATSREAHRAIVNSSSVAKILLLLHSWSLTHSTALFKCSNLWKEGRSSQLEWVIPLFSQYFI